MTRTGRSVIAGLTAAVTLALGTVIVPVAAADDGDRAYVVTEVDRFEVPGGVSQTALDVTTNTYVGLMQAPEDNGQIWLKDLTTGTVTTVDLTAEGTLDSMAVSDGLAYLSRPGTDHADPSNIAVLDLETGQALDGLALAGGCRRALHSFADTISP